MSDSKAIEGRLARVFAADQALREAREELLSGDDRDGLVKALGREVDKGLGDPSSESAAMRLVCAADLLGDVGTAEACRHLVRLLSHEEEAVHYAAGDRLKELMYERYGEVARVLEAEIDRNALSPNALGEAAYLLAEVGEPGGAKIIAKLLKHKDSDVVGAAIESLASLGDPESARLIEPLRNDKRKVTAEDEVGDWDEVTVGDIAEDAIRHLRSPRAH